MLFHAWFSVGIISDATLNTVESPNEKTFNDNNDADPHF
jgi:hypothetical protein